MLAGQKGSRYHPGVQTSLISVGKSVYMERKNNIGLLLWWESSGFDRQGGFDVWFKGQARECIRRCGVLMLTYCRLVSSSDDY